MKPLLLSLFLLASLLFAGCTGVLAPSDPRPVEEIVAQAEQLIKEKAYAEAAQLYAAALVKQPENGRYYLRRSELLEALGLDDDSRTNYRIALKKLPADAPERLEVMQRLALLSAEHLQDIDTAEDLLEQMPPGSAPRLGLSGYLYYQAKQPEMALKTFNQALAKTDDYEQKAIILYHAALVYDALRDQKNTVTSLFHAINHTKHLGLIRDITILWEKVEVNDPLPLSNRPND